MDETGNVTTHKKGTAYITVKAKGYDRLTKSVRVTVDSDYRIVNYRRWRSSTRTPRPGHTTAKR